MQGRGESRRRREAQGAARGRAGEASLPARAVLGERRARHAMAARTLGGAKGELGMELDKLGGRVWKCVMCLVCACGRL